jgi:V8-like Glu-specific endopeptidase
VPSRSFVALVPSLALIAGAAWADEGMWTFDNFPRELVRERYGVTIDDAWLENVRLATVRISGCTGSFVSPNGLILTNHHCVSSCLAQGSTRERSLIDSGFVARGRETELDCATQIADVLEKLENVTAKVQEATRGLPERDANERRRQTLTQLEQACESASQTSGNPLKCEAVTLYNGGQYWLYQYHRYDDVRLVFAPEDDIAAFGGDPDNFQYPRWCLDFSLLRAYENGRPAATPRHLTIDFEGPSAGEAVFVPGHPGSTDRELTVAELRALRDRSFPPALLRASELRGRYLQFAKTGEDARRIVQDALFSLENSLKVQRKQLDALLDDAQLTEKREAEADLRARVNRKRALAAEIGDPWRKIEDALAVEAARFLPYQYLEGGAGFNSRLYRYARTLVRAAAERPKPNAERLREYTDGFLPRMEQQLAAPVPIYSELERLTLSFSLERMREWLGPDAPIVQRLLTAETPDEIAARLIDGSGLADPAVRMALWNGGQAAIDASTDPLIALARSLDAEARELRKWHEDNVEAVIEAAHEQIARARFEILGTSVYPDATFTLRLNFGSVQGWIENGTPVEPFTHLDRLFERETGQPPFRVPAIWQQAKPALDLETPFNLSTNSDIVGGNSGSPLVAADGRLVGLLFDGNIHSISGAYWFDDAKNRAVAVHPAIIREALTKVYKVEPLIEELGLAN